MSAQEKNRTVSAAAVEVGPGQGYVIFAVMEEIVDKLKLLNYEQEFCRELKFKPINKHYFAIQTNPGEQFHVFSSLCAWLIRKTGKSFEQPQEYDDPNSTISSILDNMRNNGISVDFPPSKLKQGFGEQAIFVLDRLADEALKYVNFTWGKPVYPPEEEEEVIPEDSAELTLDKVEEELMAAEDEDDEDNNGILDLMKLGQQNKHHPFNTYENAKPENIMESTVDSAEWKLELERILPQLKVTVTADNKDWRSHIEQVHQYRSDISESLSTTHSQLDKLHLEISNTLEKIGSREKYLNNQLENLLSEFRSAQDRLAQTREQYREVSGGVTERSQTLAQVTEELDVIKQEMDERGSSMTDGKPLVNIRKALMKLKTEIAQMDVRIGVASHTLLQARLKERGTMQQDLINIASLPMTAENLTF